MEDSCSDLCRILSEENDKSSEEGTDDEDDYDLDIPPTQLSPTSSSDNDKVN